LIERSRVEERWKPLTSNKEIRRLAPQKSPGTREMVASAAEARETVEPLQKAIIVHPPGDFRCDDFLCSFDLTGYGLGG